MTTLDTHDGIGVVDVVDLLTSEEIEETKELLYEKGANVKKNIAVQNIITLIFIRLIAVFILRLETMTMRIC